MKKFHLKTLFPAIIFSLCILELSFGLLISFQVVWLFYLFFLFFIFNLKPVTRGSSKLVKVNLPIVLLYFLSAAIYLIHHFLSSHLLFDVSTADSYNILWWSLFGLFLIMLIKTEIIDYHLFWRYTYIIVFFGSVISAGFGVVKYFNILNGRTFPSYFYNNNLILGSSLSSDYNLYSIGLLIGAVFSFQVRKLYKGRMFNVFYLLCLSLIYLSSFISGSRRGFLLTIAVIFLGIFYENLLKSSWRKSMTFSIVLISFFSLLAIFWGSLIETMESSGFIDSSITRIFTIKEEFSGENNRTMRFSWAYDKFSKSTTNEIIFGNGFGYLSEMGSAFRDSEEDHPHNFVLSTLLYGGLLALFLIIVLLKMMLSSTFSNNKTLFFSLLILIFFSLSSANSLFSFRIFPTMVFLSSLHILSLRRGVTFRENFN